ncbi:MAG: hypothetical protein WC520_00315 [Candidatus Paceibacterota bacterium]
MNKKIYDIIPPDQVGKETNCEPYCEKDFNLEPAQNDIPVIVKKPRRSFGSFKIIILIIFVGLIVGAFVFPAKAEVKIYPKTEDVSASDIAIVDASQQFADLERKTVPGFVFTEEREYSETYNSTGNDSQAAKAKGKIRVYNKYSPVEPLTLKLGTHFLSTPKGLSYHSLAVINVPAGKVSGGKVEPGYVDIEVEADEAGADYNLSSATFSVPKLNGTAYYSTTWAETQGAISGGSSSNIKVVSKKDIDSGEEIFKAKYLAQAKDSLKSLISDEYIFFEENISQTIDSITVSAKENEAVATFEIKGKITSKVTAIKKEDLKAFAEKAINATVEGQAKQIAPNSLSYSITSQKETNGKTELQLSYSAKIYWIPDNEFLLASIAGKAKDYSASILGNIPEIDKTEINVFPFWKSTIPTSSDKVNIQIKF